MKEVANEQAVIRFLGYRLVNVNYVCSPDFELNTITNGKYHFSFTKVGALLSDTQYQLNLIVRLCYSNEADYESAPLRLVIELAGRYECEESWSDRWEANALAILFPYLRAMVSTVTAQSGREPVVLPTVNIVQLFKNAAENKEKMQKHLSE